MTAKNTNADRDAACLKAKNQYLQRFDSRVTKTNDCHLFINANSQTYGRFWIAGKTMPAHRVALLWAKGMPASRDAAYACHGCHNKSCVNPLHLYWGDAKDNAADAKKQGRLFSRCFKYPRHQTPTNTCSKEQVLLFWDDWNKSCDPTHVVAARHGIKTSMAHSILSRKSYSGYTNRLIKRRSKFSHGSHPKGENHHAARLTESQVREIFERIRSGGNNAGIAKELGVKYSDVKGIRLGYVWRWVTGLVRKDRKYAHVTRTFTAGSAHHKAKLDKEKIYEILKKLDTGLGSKSVASDYGVSYNVINDIKRGKTYRQEVFAIRSAEKKQDEHRPR